MWVVKEFLKVLTREEKSFYLLSKIGKGRTHRVALALKVWGLSLLLSLKVKVQVKGVCFYLF